MGKEIVAKDTGCGLILISEELYICRVFGRLIVRKTMTSEIGQVEFIIIENVLTLHHIALHVSALAG